MRGTWYTPESKAGTGDGFPLNTLDGGLKSPKALNKKELTTHESEGA